ncbi:MAG: hypothetical protein AB1601_16190 [Planctomycetota bacterium]
MELRWGKRRFEDWDELRERLVAETSVYLTEALRHPELAVRIPMIPAGSGRFPPSLTRAFWDPVLFD